MITKRIAPLGYVAVDKREAKKAFDAGYDVTVAGNNVNSFHVFGGWHLGCTINNKEDADWQRHINAFLFYLDRELGSYPVFYVNKRPL